MRAGDLLEMKHDNTRWIVRRVLPKARIVQVLGADGSERELASNAEEVGDVVVLVNVPESWPMVAAPMKRNGGRVKEIRRPRTVLKFDVLVPFVDWVASDPLREGGPIFFNPSLNVRPGEVMVAEHVRGTLSRITIPAKFGTVNQRVAVQDAKRAPPRPRDAFDVLLDDENE